MLGARMRKRMRSKQGDAQGVSAHNPEGAHTSHHVTSVGAYVAVFIALMVLTAATVAVAFVDLGAFNDLVAMAIAILKATLVILIFMGVRHATRLNKLIVLTGILFLVILFGITLSDYFTRDFLL